MLGLLTAHAEPVEIVKAPMVGYAAADSRPFEVVAWRSIGLMRPGRGRRLAVEPRLVAQARR